MPANGLSAQLQTYGYFGQSVPAPLTLNYTAGAAWRKALSDGSARSVRLLTSETGRDALQRDAESETTPPLTLDWRVVYPDAWNAPVAWGNLQNGYEPEALPSAFETGIGVGHTNGNPNIISAYRLDAAGAGIPQNGAWALRLYLRRQPEAQTNNAFIITWGGWLILISNDGAEIARVSDAYTTDKQISLLALLQLVEPTEAQSAAADDLREEIYDDRQSLQARGEWFNSNLEFVAIPEPAGRVHLWINGEYQAIEHTGIGGEYGIVWPETKLSVRCEGGAYFWQAGYPSPAATGKLRLGKWDMGVWVAYVLSNAETTKIADENGGVITVTSAPISIADAEIVVTLTPDATRRRFPFLYHIGASIPGGMRNGGFASGAKTWDSADHNNPIMDVEPSFEGTHRRAQYSVTMRDPLKTNFLSAGANNGILENQIAKLTIGGAVVITNGLVMESLAVDVADPITHRNSTNIVARVCDAWARLDEDVMDDAPVGDGQYLGAYLNDVLRNGGFSPNQRAYVYPTDGRRLPAAIGGEAPLFLPRGGVTRGEYLRALVEEWGLGWRLYIAPSGVWQFAPQSTTPVIAFNNSGGVRILREFNLPREVSEFANYVRVTSTDWRGNPIAEDFPLWASITGAGSKSYVGRKILMERNVPTARTATDLYYVRRSIHEQFKGAPRYQAFETEYQTGVYPGDYCTVAGVLCRIKSINGGSIAGNRMSWLAQEQI